MNYNFYRFIIWLTVIVTDGKVANKFNNVRSASFRVLKENNSLNTKIKTKITKDKRTDPSSYCRTR